MKKIKIGRCKHGKSCIESLPVGSSWALGRRRFVLKSPSVQRLDARMPAIRAQPLGGSFDPQPHRCGT